MVALNMMIQAVSLHKLLAAHAANLTLIFSMDPLMLNQSRSPCKGLLAESAVIIFHSLVFEHVFVNRTTAVRLEFAKLTLVTFAEFVEAFDVFL